MFYDVAAAANTNSHAITLCNSASATFSAGKHWVILSTLVINKQTWKNVHVWTLVVLPVPSLAEPSVGDRPRDVHPILIAVRRPGPNRRTMEMIIAGVMWGGTFHVREFLNLLLIFHDFSFFILFVTVIGLERKHNQPDQ